MLNTIKNKIRRLKRRHNLPFFSSLSYELYIRLYRYSLSSRKLLQFFSKVTKPKQMIFLVGCYNSGTTVTKNVIGLHPDVSSAPIEGDLLTSEITNLEEGGWHRCLYGNKDKILAYRKSVKLNQKKLLKDWSPWIKPNTYFLEKSVANSVRMNQLREAFPGCKFVNVTRAPQDVVNGILKRSKPTNEAASTLKANSYPEKILYCQWSFIYSLISKDSKEEDTFFCSYENFILHPKEVTEQMYNFLGLQSIPVSFNQENDMLHLGTEKIFIRPLPKREKSNLDYSLKSVVDSKIKELNCV